MSARIALRQLVRPLAVVVTASALAVPVGLVSAQGAAAHPRGGERLSWQDSTTGSTARFRGLAPVSRKVAWVSGTAGTVLRTTDGGRTWDDVSPGGDTGALQFRDIEAFDARHAVILSIGDTTDAFRVYRTSDGGRTWQLGFTNTDPAAFYDCMGFWDPRHGIAMSDPVDGKFRIITTADGGRSWSVVDPAGMVPALDGEFGFAASGTCLVTAGSRDAWIATGGGAQSRVLRTHDGGRTWRAATTAVPSGPSAGIYSLAVRGRGQLLAVGGDFALPDAGVVSATSFDAGHRFLTGGANGGYRSGSAWLPRAWASAIAVGPTGSDVSTDAGRHWRTFDTTSLDSVACTRDGACWGSGEAGRVTKLVGQPR